MKTFRKILSLSLKIFIVVVVLGITAIGVLYVSSGDPQLDLNKIKQSAPSTSIYDGNNHKVDVSELTRKVQYEDLPANLINAFVSMEDKKFFEHHGIDYHRLAGATWQNIKQMSFAEGASTITQQLIKNTHLSIDKTITRKVQEMKLADKLENNMSKEEILTAYLNIIYFGNSIYGVKQAALTFFDKDLSALTLSECAALTAIVKSPALYSPLKDLNKCIERRDLVLSEMKKDGIISESEYSTALSEELTVKTKINKNDTSYIDAVIAEASKILGISEEDFILSGYSVYTYLDPEVQSKLVSVCKEEDNLPKTLSGNIPDVCGIVTDNTTGGIIAYYNNTYFNYTDLRVQPGSVIKPFTAYLPAMSKNLISPASPILDEYTDFNGYKPGNYGGKYSGWIDVRTAVAKSINIPAVKCMNYAGIEYSIDYAKKFGIKFDERDYSLASALGGLTYGATPHEMTGAYMTLANGGYYIKPVLIREIRNQNNKPVYSNNEYKQKIITAEDAYIMTDMLKSSVKTGSSTALNNENYNIAAKTGTASYGNTEYNNNLWSISYTSANTVCMLIGNADNVQSDAMPSSATAAKYPTELADKIYSKIYKENFPQNFSAPDGILKVKLDKSYIISEHKLILANEFTLKENVIEEIFTADSVPQEYAKTIKIIVKDFDIKIKNFMPEISFSAEKNLIYEVHRIDKKNKDEIIYTFKNSSGKITYSDKSIFEGEIYEYYILPKFIGQEETAGEPSQKRSVIIPYSLFD